MGCKMEGNKELGLLGCFCVSQAMIVVFQTDITTKKEYKKIKCKECAFESEGIDIVEQHLHHSFDNLVIQQWNRMVRSKK